MSNYDNEFSTWRKTFVSSTSVVQLEDEKRDHAEQMQRSVAKHEDLLPQLNNPVNDQKVQMQHHQLLKRKRQEEDICGCLKEKRKTCFPLIYFIFKDGRELFTAFYHS